MCRENETKPGESQSPVTLEDKSVTFLTVWLNNIVQQEDILDCFTYGHLETLSSKTTWYCGLTLL